MLTIVQFGVRTSAEPSSRLSAASFPTPSWCSKRAALPTIGAGFSRSFGHSVRLIPPQYVKPFVKRGKNDRNDAAAICEAVSAPQHGFVP